MANDFLSRLSCRWSRTRRECRNPPTPPSTAGAQISPLGPLLLILRGLPDRSRWASNCRGGAVGAGRPDHFRDYMVEQLERFYQIIAGTMEQVLGQEVEIEFVPGPREAVTGDVLMAGR